MRPPARYRITESSLDTALRYQTAIGLFADRYRPDLAILEVGAGSGGITEFLDHPVTGVDIAFSRTAERATALLTQVEASAEALPFPDASYDIVLSLEMLEHVSSNKRDAVLREMVRVVRPGGRTIVSFPCDETAVVLDRWLNAAYRRKSGVDHPWASEHIELGVPVLADVVALVEAMGRPDLRVTTQRHMWAPVHRTVHGLYTARRFSKLTRPLGLHTRAATTVLFHALRHLHRAPAYRAFLVIDRAAAHSDGHPSPTALNPPRATL